MRELDCEESWAPKNWRFWTVVLENTLEGPLDFKEIQPVHSKGDQSWVFFGRNDAKAETPVLRPPHAKSWLSGKDSDAGRDWGQEEKGTTEDEMAGWHHGLDGCEFEWTPGVGDGQGGLACCNSWGCKESDTTELLNWTESLLDHLTMTLFDSWLIWISSPKSLPGQFHNSMVAGWVYQVHFILLLKRCVIWPRKEMMPLNKLPNTDQVSVFNETMKNSLIVLIVIISFVYSVLSP